MAEEEEDYSEERKAAFLTTVFNYLWRSQGKPDGKWELFFHLDQVSWRVKTHYSDSSTTSDIGQEI